LTNSISNIEYVENIKAFVDLKTNKSAYFVGRITYGSLYSELKKDESGKYVPEYRFATPKT
jgi:hypothetical protein